jgi:hypothetical protein
VIQSALVDLNAVADPNAPADRNVELVPSAEILIAVIQSVVIQSAAIPSATGETPNVAILILAQVVAQASASRCEVIQSARDESQTAAIPVYAQDEVRTAVLRCVVIPCAVTLDVTVVRQNEVPKIRLNGAQSVVPVATRLDSNVAQTEVGLVQNPPDLPPLLAPA